MAEQRQSGEESEGLQPDAVSADLDEAEPNVLVYSLSAAGDSIQQALSALAHQVILQALSHAKSAITSAVADTQAFVFAEAIKSWAVLHCYYNTSLVGTDPAIT